MGLPIPMSDLALFPFRDCRDHKKDDSGNDKGRDPDDITKECGQHLQPAGLVLTHKTLVYARKDWRSGVDRTLEPVFTEVKRMEIDQRN